MKVKVEVVTVVWGKMMTEFGDVLLQFAWSNGEGQYRLFLFFRRIRLEDDSQGHAPLEGFDSLSYA